MQWAGRQYYDECILLAELAEASWVERQFIKLKRGARGGNSRRTVEDATHATLQ